MMRRAATLALLAGACASAPLRVYRGYPVTDVNLSQHASDRPGVHVHAVYGETDVPFAHAIAMLTTDGYVSAETDANGDAWLPLGPGAHELEVATDDGSGSIDVTSGTDVEAKLWPGGCILIGTIERAPSTIDPELVGSKLTYDAHDLHNLPR